MNAPFSVVYLFFFAFVMWLSPLALSRRLADYLCHARTQLFSACVHLFARSLSPICSSLASCPHFIVITHSLTHLFEVNELFGKLLLSRILFFCVLSLSPCSLSLFSDGRRCVRCVPHTATNHIFATFGRSSLNLLSKVVVHYIVAPCGALSFRLHFH